MNGYPRDFIEKFFMNRKENKQHHNEQKDAEYPVYLKVPFVNELHKRKMIKARDQHGLTEYVRFIFITQPPLKISLRPSKETRPCNDNCVSCLTAEIPGQCYKKKCDL